MPGEENGGDGVCKRSLSWSVASLPGTETYVFRSSYVAFLTVQTFAGEKARLKGRGRPDGARALVVNHKTGCSCFRVAQQKTVRQTLGILYFLLRSCYKLQYNAGYVCVKLQKRYCIIDTVYLYMCWGRGQEVVTYASRVESFVTGIKMESTDQRSF